MNQTPQNRSHDRTLNVKYYFLEFISEVWIHFFSKTGNPFNMQLL